MAFLTYDSPYLIHECNIWWSPRALMSQTRRAVRKKSLHNNNNNNNNNNRIFSDLQVANSSSKLRFEANLPREDSQSPGVQSTVKS